MRTLRYLFLALGMGLLALVLAETDLDQALSLLPRIGIAGATAVLALYFFAFLADSLSWQLTLANARLTLGWAYLLWNVRMVGEAFNNVLPAASFGGEPVKAVLLKRRRGVAYTETAASIVLTRTVNLLALILFCGIAFALMTVAEEVPRSLTTAAGAGLAALAVAVILFYAVQRGSVASRVFDRIVARFHSRRLASAAMHMRNLDDLFVGFYRRNSARVAGAFALSFLNWLLGAAEIWAILHFLGQPIAWPEAWIVAGVVELIRAGTFFIPAGIGSTELGFVLIVDAITGTPGVGLACALVRRLREIVFIGWGLALGWGMPVSRELDRAMEK